MSRKPQDPKFPEGLYGKNGKQAANENVPSDVYRRGVAALQDALLGLHADAPTLNKLELASVRSLIAYVADVYSLSEDVVRSLVEENFETNDIQKIHQTDFDKAIAYLADLNPRMHVN